MTSQYLKQWWLDYRGIYTSLGLNELTQYPFLNVRYDMIYDLIWCDVICYQIDIIWSCILQMLAFFFNLNISPYLRCAIRYEFRLVAGVVSKSPWCTICCNATSQDRLAIQIILIKCTLLTDWWHLRPNVECPQRVSYTEIWYFPCCWSESTSEQTNGLFSGDFRWHDACRRQFKVLVYIAILDTIQHLAR